MCGVMRCFKFLFLLIVKMNFQLIIVILVIAILMLLKSREDFNLAGAFIDLAAGRGF